MTEKQKRDFERWKEAREKRNPADRAKMERGARIAMAYGLFLLITVGTSIAGAVNLFRQRAAKFIVVAAVLALTAEVLGCVLAAVVLGAGVGATKLVFSSVGIIAGILALFGARQISMANATADPPSTAAPT